jgi:hypothetical protein
MSLADIFSPPKPIDPSKIQGYMHSDYTDKLGQLGDNMLDPNSGLNQAWKNSFNLQAQDNAYTQNRLSTANQFRGGMSNQSGILEAIKNQNTGKSLGEGMEGYRGFALGQGQNAMGAYQGAQQGDLATGEAMASAYGQNITNRNNYNSGMMSTVMGLAGPALMMACDPKFKRNMKRVGSVKTTKKPIGMYEFNYKFDPPNAQKRMGFNADDIKKQFKSAVHKDRNGMDWVNMNKMREVIR